MRGDDDRPASMFSYVPLEQRIPSDHPLRPLRSMVDEALRGLSRRLSGLYARTGRPSIPPERLLRALLIQILYSVRSERMLMEQLQYNLLFRWFVGLDMDDPVWDATVFTKNRDRLLAGDVARAFFAKVLEQARAAQLLSSEHFTVDGTLIEAWASQKSFVRKDGQDRDDDGDPGNPTVSFRGEKRSNATHQSTTDPEARLTRAKGKEARLAYHGHVLMENRHGLVVDARLTQASGTAEREAALAMIESVPGRRRITLAADRGYDVRLRGTLRYLPEKQTFDRFDVAAVGEHWGEGTYTRRARPGRTLLGVAFGPVAGDAPADRVPPQAAREVGRYFGKY